MLSNQNILSSLSICGRITLDMHSLNNEGSEGNQVLTRQVTIVDANGDIATVNAVSGDMLKHIQAEHFWQIATERGLPLGSDVNHPNRIGVSPEFRKLLEGVDVDEFLEEDKIRYESLNNQLLEEEDEKEKKKIQTELKKIEREYLTTKFSAEDRARYEKLIKQIEAGESKKKSLKKAEKDQRDRLDNDIKQWKGDKKELEKKYNVDVPDGEKMEKVLSICSLSDVAGVLVTAPGVNLPRKSCAEFGWLIAVPKINGKSTPDLQSYFHAKYVADPTTVESGEAKNLGQNIFHRPANSGVYALVANFDIYRVGYNDITRSYTIDGEARAKRVNALLQSIMRTFLSPKGAMRNTQNPHVVNFEGVITTSNTSMPAPTVSPINDSYKDVITKTTSALNSISSTMTVQAKPFSSMDEFVKEMKELLEYQPYKLEARKEQPQNPQS